MLPRQVLNLQRVWNYIHLFRTGLAIFNVNGYTDSCGKLWVWIAECTGFSVGFSVTADYRTLLPLLPSYANDLLLGHPIHHSV